MFDKLVQAQSEWDRLLEASFLSDAWKEKYRDVLEDRRTHLGLD